MVDFQLLSTRSEKREQQRACDRTNRLSRAKWDLRQYWPEGRQCCIRLPFFLFSLTEEENKRKYVRKIAGRCCTGFDSAPLNISLHGRYKFRRIMSTDVSQISTSNLSTKSLFAGTPLHLASCCAYNQRS